MATILDEISAYKLEEIKAHKAERPLAEIESRARSAAPPRGFQKALESARRTQGYGLICGNQKGQSVQGPDPC